MLKLRIKTSGRKLLNYIQKRTFICSQFLKTAEKSVEISSIDPEEKFIKEYEDLVEQHLIRPAETHNCLVVQPYVKWGPQKLKISPNEQLDEGEALVDTLPGWTVEDKIMIPLDNIQRKTLFKKGSMERLQDIVQKNGKITAVFVNIGTLKLTTLEILRDNFRVPIFDRYKIVIHILKMHAISKHAKLQVSLAELYYIQRTIGNLQDDNARYVFNSKEHKLKTEIQELRNQRSLLRRKRKKLNIPVVAVVGYTNAGKTSVIKALTGDKSLEPRNQLFATLDVTAYSGILPSGLEIIYIDTVGFISDIPTNLIECFVATLEDAMLADVILNVEDVSSSCYDFKRQHVLRTLQQLCDNFESDLTNKILSVGNKSDLLRKKTDSAQDFDKELLLISAKSGIGMNELQQRLEEAVLKNTERKIITFKVPNGGIEIRWLFKNSVVVNQIPDERDTQLINAKVIITGPNFEKFKHCFVTNRASK